MENLFIKEDTELWLKATDTGISKVTEREVTNIAIYRLDKFIDLFLKKRIAKFSPIFTVIRTQEDYDEYRNILDSFPDIKKDLNESISDKQVYIESDNYKPFTKQDIDTFSNMIEEAKGIELSCPLFYSDSRSKIMRVKSVMVSIRTVILYTNNGNILLDIDKINDWYVAEEFFIVSYDSDTFIKIWIQ